MSATSTTIGNYTTVNQDEVRQWFDHVDGDYITVPPQAQEMLEKYSGIPPEKIEEHVLALRDKAWKVHPYPCIGQFRFLELNLAGRTDADMYKQLVARLLDGDRFLDVGCCLGQDVRKLMFDGVPRENLEGAELERDFIDLGYELFRDSPHTAPKMTHLNILEDLDKGPMRSAKGTFDVVQLGMMLHILSRAEQIIAFENAIRLLKPEKKGTAIIGQATGHVDGIEIENTPSWKKSSFRHSVESFEKLVEEVSERTGTEWKVRALLDNGLGVYDGKRTWDDPGTRRILFEVTRI